MVAAAKQEAARMLDESAVTIARDEAESKGLITAEAERYVASRISAANEAKRSHLEQARDRITLKTKALQEHFSNQSVRIAEILAFPGGGFDDSSD